MTVQMLPLEQIYSKNFQYSLPKEVLKSFLSGVAFDNKTPYTEDERSALDRDIFKIYQNITSQSPVKKPIAYISAGAPGAGKTTLMRQLLAKEKQPFAYVCPDDVCLIKQEETYLQEIANGNGTVEERRGAYDKWRPGSNAAAHLIVANLIREKYAFYFGSTSSSPMTAKFYELIKNQDYEIRVIHVSAPDDVRWASIQERDKKFVQTTEEDVINKAKLMPDRIQDTFLKYADSIDFYYRNGVGHDAKLSATWMRNENEGQLFIENREGYENVQKIHNAAANWVAHPELHWDALFKIK